MIRAGFISRREDDGACLWPMDGRLVTSPPAATNSPEAINNLQRKTITMGDRSPKSTQKQASQKQAKADASNNKKQAQITSQQATKLKAAALKKK